jgi:hypothetical protein
MTVFPRGVNQTIPNTRKKKNVVLYYSFQGRSSLPLDYRYSYPYGMQSIKRKGVHVHTIMAYVVNGGTPPRINLGITTQPF